MITKPRLLTTGELAKAVGVFESKVRRFLHGRPDLVILAGDRRCVDAQSLPEIQRLIGQAPAVAGPVEGV